jgi:short-subunit dehydrogenase
MSEKYIVFGATGSIGSSLAEQLVSSGNNVHLVARNEDELKIFLTN